MTSAKPRLSIVLFFAFLLTSIIPVVVVGIWVIDFARDNEYSAVKEKHLLVAKNITLALSRYALDISSTLKFISLVPYKEITQPHKELLNIQNIVSYRVFSEHSKPLFSMSTSDDYPLQKLTDKQLNLAKNYKHTSIIQFLAVEKNSLGSPVIMIVGAIPANKNYFIAELTTQYFIQLQSKIKFGLLGHAAIVDQTGKVLAHPKKSWVDDAKNISKVSAVQRMMNGETGVEQFYSPAEKIDMIAGFSTVKMTGWGVMVPQPINELEAKINHVKEASFIVTLIGVFLSMIVSWRLANSLAKPIRSLAKLSRHLEAPDTQPNISSNVPTYTKEQHELSEAFNAMIISLRKKNNELLYSAQHDPLTNLANRNLLRETLGKKTLEKNSFIFILLDLNEFKDINDHWSHAHGDKVLIQVSQRLNNIVKDQGLVTRIGGDEFAIVFNTNITKQQAELLTRSIQKSIKNHFTILKERLKIDSSCGLASYPEDADNISDLMQCADLAMYAAKQDINSSFQWFNNSMKNKLDHRVEMTQELVTAIEEKQFILQYQPKIDPKNYQIKGFEALVRWQHPTKGMIFPDNFIELAEKSGNILALGELIIDLACQDINKWRQSVKTLPIAINLSICQFDDKNLANKIIDIVTRHNINPSELEFEITESSFMDHAAQTKILLQQIRSFGFKLSVDDFGTGHSSLARIKNMDVQKIKIDKVFVDDIEHNSKALALLKVMIDIGQTLALDVIVEGVETKPQLDIVTGFNCTEVQGYIFSKAVNANQVTSLISDNTLTPS